jgi:hypothetical protein
MPLPRNSQSLPAVSWSGVWRITSARCKKVFGSMAVTAEGLDISLYSDDKTRDTIQSCVGAICGLGNPLDLILGEYMNQMNQCEDK